MDIELISGLVCRFSTTGYTNKYRALKVLSIECTGAWRTGLSRELEFLQQIAEDEDCDELSRLEDHFCIAGPGGTHLSLVMTLYSTDVSTFRRSAPTKSLPIYTTKNIITSVLQGLSQLHRLKIIHTGIYRVQCLINCSIFVSYRYKTGQYPLQFHPK